MNEEDEVIVLLEEREDSSAVIRSQYHVIMTVKRSNIQTCA